MSIQRYKSMLENGYAASVDFTAGVVESRAEYLSQFIFEFLTYDGAVDELWVQKAVEVCEAITNESTFEYIKNRDNYGWYLLMCNMPFFADKLTYGTSIRGAWWDTPIKLSSCGLWDGDRQIIQDLVLDKPEWTAFINALVEFSRGETN